MGSRAWAGSLLLPQHHIPIKDPGEAWVLPGQGCSPGPVQGFFYNSAASSSKANSC